MDRWSRDALMDMSRVSIYACFLFFAHACAGLRMCIFVSSSSSSRSHLVVGSLCAFLCVREKCTR